MTADLRLEKGLPLAHAGTLPMLQRSVHVWVLGGHLVEAACAALGHYLSSDERERARAYRQPIHRDGFIARRGVLRWLAGRYLGRPPESLQFGLGPFGKPGLRLPSSPKLGFSVSRTEGMMLFAFAWDCFVGVDVEKQLSGLDFAAAGQEVFSSSEAGLLNASGIDPASAFFKTWTRKEALLKALGTGLSGDPKAYTAEDDARCAEHHWRASHESRPMNGWTFIDLALSPGFRAALAVSAKGLQVSVRNLEPPPLPPAPPC